MHALPLEARRSRGGTRRDILRLKAADPHANLTAIQRALDNPDIGRQVWDRFKVGRDDSLWFYLEIADPMTGGLPCEQLAVGLHVVLDGVVSASHESAGAPA